MESGRLDRMRVIFESPGTCSGAFFMRQVRVLIRIMKLSKDSSATCIHISESVR
jgi:hypothetical protein